MRKAATCLVNARLERIRGLRISQDGFVKADLKCRWTYLAGLRKGRHNERKRVLAILRARLDPYDDDANESLLSAIKKIQGLKR